MDTIEKKIIFLVDDDAVFLKLLEVEFKLHTPFEVITFPSGESCLENLNLKPYLIVLDYHLDGLNSNAMNGIMILDKIKSTHEHIPVVMLSSQDKIEVAVDCMHHHALDYITKSETSFIRLQKVINTYATIMDAEKKINWYRDKI